MQVKPVCLRMRAGDLLAFGGTDSWLVTPELID